MKSEEILSINAQVEELYNFVVFLSTLGQIERQAVHFIPLDYHPLVIQTVKERIKNQTPIFQSVLTGSTPVDISSEQVDK